MQRSVFLFLALVLILIPLNTFAGTEQGAKEVQFQGSFVNGTNDDNDNKTINSTGQISVNYFFTDWFSLGGTARLSGSKFEFESGGDTTFLTAFLLIGADFYLGDSTSTIVPYVGGRMGFANYYMETDNDDDSSTTISYGGHGGFKIFASENISWNLELDLTQYTPDLDTEDDVTYTDITFLVGFSYYF